MIFTIYLFFFLFWTVRVCSMRLSMKESLPVWKISVALIMRSSQFMNEVWMSVIHARFDSQQGFGAGVEPTF